MGGVKGGSRPCSNSTASRYFCLALLTPINNPLGSVSILSPSLSLAGSLSARALFRFCVGLCDVTASTGYAGIIHEPIQLRNYENSGYFILLTCAPHCYVRNRHAHTRGVVGRKVLQLSPLCKLLED